MRKHFEGRRTRPPPLFTYPSKLTLQNVPVERFGQSNSPKRFVQFVQDRYLFRQTEPPQDIVYPTAAFSIIELSYFLFSPCLCIVKLSVGFVYSLFQVIAVEHLTAYNAH